MTAVEELQDTTSGFGWPASLKVYRRGEHVFFEVQAVVELLGVEKQVRKHGFKFSDKFLRENGLKDSFIFSKNQRNRELVSYAAFVMLIIRYPAADDTTKALRMLILQPILLPPPAGTIIQPPSTPATVPPGTPAAVQPPSTPAAVQPPTPAAVQPPSTPAAVQSPSTPAAVQPPSTPAAVPPATPAAVQPPSTPAAVQPPSTPASVPASQLLPTPARPPLTPLNCYQGTKKLVELQMKRRSEQNCGRKFASRPLANRMKEQNGRLFELAREVNHGSKKDLLAGIARSVSNSSNKQESENEWDGQLTVQDIVELTKMTHDKKKGKSVYEMLTVDAAAEIHRISSFQVLKMQDSFSQKETFRNLRKLLPGFIESERRTDQLRYKWHKEFEVVLEPSRTKTGWRINPERLRKCVSFAYPWLQNVDTEWWRLYGDARNFGGQKSVLLSLSILNNEAMFNDCSFQSPEENCWPIHIFYGPDSRLNLEINTGGGNGYLNTWIDSLAQEGHKTFVASDNMFANAILGGGLDPKSNDNFSIYAFETTSTRSAVGENSGLRSELKRQIEREHPESLLPAVPTNHFIPCANHMFVRITEHLLSLRVMSCLNEGVVNNEKSGTLTKLLSNINTRGVRGGNFQLKFDGPKLEPISLNVSHAETISAPPEAFSSTFPHILDGVAENEQFPQTLSSGLQTALGWPTNTITYYDLEKKIWETHWKMHVLCRKDPDPRMCDTYLLPGSSSGSKSAADYRFGLLDCEIEEYTRLADLHHGLMLLRYGSSRLYPYLMTRVDIVPLLLKELPFHSLFRGSTEGGEHCHYLHQCIYYAHSSRGGGWRKEEPILALFKWTFRRLREKIEQAGQTGEFLTFVQSCFTDIGRDYTKEFDSNNSTPETIAQPNSTLASNAQPDSTLPTNTQPNSSPVTDEQPSSTLATITQPNSTPATITEPNSTPVSNTDADYRRGKTVYFSTHRGGQVNKGMVINLTPRKKHIKVATSSKERPMDVALDQLKEPPPQPLKNHRFIISGNIAERGEKEKVNTEKLAEIINNLGGIVFSGDVEKAADASLIIITSQKEINKPTQKLNKTLVMAYRLGWKIISKKLILEARNTNTLPSISHYELDLTSIRNAPASNVVHAKVFTKSSMINNHQVVGGHRELKKKLRESSKRKNSENEMPQKSFPKKPCTAYVMFSKQMWKSIITENPHFTMHEVNSVVSEMWKQVGNEDRSAYRQKALENYERRLEHYNSANRQP